MKNETFINLSNQSIIKLLNTKMKKRDLITKEQISEFLSPELKTKHFPNKYVMKNFVESLNEGELKFMVGWLRQATSSYRKSYDKFEIIESVLGTGGLTTSSIAISTLSLTSMVVAFPFLFAFLGVGLFYANDYKNKRQILYNLKYKKELIDNQIIKNIQRRIK